MRTEKTRTICAERICRYTEFTTIEKLYESKKKIHCISQNMIVIMFCLPTCMHNAQLKIPIPC